LMLAGISIMLVRLAMINMPSWISKMLFNTQNLN